MSIRSQLQCQLDIHDAKARAVPIKNLHSVSARAVGHVNILAPRPPQFEDFFLGSEAISPPVQCLQSAAGVTGSFLIAGNCDFFERPNQVLHSGFGISGHCAQFALELWSAGSGNGNCTCRDPALQIWQGVAVIAGEQGGEFAGDVFRHVA